MTINELVEKIKALKEKPGINIYDDVWNDGIDACLRTINEYKDSIIKKTEDIQDDVVNHPSHYTFGGMECIDEMVAIFGSKAVAAFCLCNVWKYRKRAIHKNGEEDLKKSDWYMKKFVELKNEKL